MLNSEEIKKEFPIFETEVHGRKLIYLDNAATTQKPKCVIEELVKFYSTMNANIHRGIHKLSELSTEAFENSREKVREFINAKHSEEIIFTKNATESINLVANTWGEENIQEGDEILISILEHHANFVPWQNLAKKKNAKLVISKLTEDFTFDLEDFKNKLSEKTKLVACTGASNVLGTVTPIKEIIKLAQENGAKTLVDGTQLTAHSKVDIQNLNCDFYVFSAHKMCGPTGVGVLYGKKELLEEMPPFLLGGDMIKSVSETETIYNDLPNKFEAGTPNIADIIAFHKTLQFLERVGMKEIREHELKLLKYAKEKFSKYPEVSLFSPSKPENCCGILSFTVKGTHPHDIASIFDSEGVAIRSGLHCAEPLVRSLKQSSTARMSFYLYNTESDIDKAEKALQKVIKIFS